MEFFGCVSGTKNIDSRIKSDYLKLKDTLSNTQKPLVVLGTGNIGLIPTLTLYDNLYPYQSHAIITVVKSRKFSPTKNIAYNEYILRLEHGDRLPRISKKKINKKYKLPEFFIYSPRRSGKLDTVKHLSNYYFRMEVAAEKIKKQFLGETGFTHDKIKKMLSLLSTIIR